jgi:hypothetical protein
MNEPHQREDARIVAARYRVDRLIERRGLASVYAALLLWSRDRPAVWRSFPRPGHLLSRSM